MLWEETQTEIRSGHRSPSEFEDGTQKAVPLNSKDGIQAIIAKPKGKANMEIQSFVFSKQNGWTLEKAKAWFSNLYSPPASEHLCTVFPFSIAEKILDKPLRIQGVAMTVGISRNLNIYTPDELAAFAEKLQNAPVYLEHVTAQDAIGKVTETHWDGQNLNYTAEIYDEDTADKIRTGLIQHVSVGADYQTIDVVNGKVPHGLYNAELSLVAVPGVAETNIKVLERLCEQLEPVVSGRYTLGFYQPADTFLPEHFTTVWLDRENGVLAFMGKPKADPGTQRTQAIYFSKEKMWDQNRLRDWLQLHPTYMTPAQADAPQAAPVVESLIKKPPEPTIPVSQAIRMIEEVLPSHIIQRSWSLGPQRMCQELGCVLYRLRNLTGQSS